nr:hypothetical protein L203_06037 [Cryptococcus depauperatus CBS 7841]
MEENLVLSILVSIDFNVKLQEGVFDVQPELRSSVNPFRRLYEKLTSMFDNRSNSIFQDETQCISSEAEERYVREVVRRKPNIFDIEDLGAKPMQAVSFVLASK